MIRPRWKDDHALLAAVAAYLRDQRADRYPALVTAGRLDPRAAADGIRIVSAIAASWAAIVAFEPEPVGAHDPDTGGAWTFERIDTLRDIAIRTRAAADAAPGEFEIAGLADAVDTLLWWETAQPSARQLADATIEGRARAASARLAQSPVSMRKAA